MPRDLCTWLGELTVISLDGEEEEGAPADDAAPPVRPSALEVDPEHSPLETLATPIFLSRVQLLTPDISGANQDGTFIPPRSRLTVRCWIYCREPVDNPLLRVQVHPLGDNTPAVVGINNHRQDAVLDLQEGCFTRADLVIEQVNLAPGSYKLSVALGADEEQDSVFSFHECCYDLTVTGDGGLAEGKIWPPEVGLTPLEGTEDPDLREAGKGLSIGALYPAGAPDAICLAAGPGAPLDLEVRLDGRARDPEAPEALMMQVYSFFPQVKLLGLPLPVPPGDHAGFLLHLDALNCLGGDHRLELLPVGARRGARAMTIHVMQERGQGGGLVYCHYHVAGAVLPRPGDLQSLGGEAPVNLLMD